MYRTSCLTRIAVVHRDNFMVAKSLREATALHRQLRRAVAGVPPETDPALPLAQLALALARSAGGGEAASLLRDPPRAVQSRLQRAVAAGWADQVRCAGSALKHSIQDTRFLLSVSAPVMREQASNSAHGVVAAAVFGRPRTGSLTGYF